MKKLVLAIFSFITITSFSQHGINFNYNENGRGQNFDLGYNYSFKQKDDLSFGLSFLLNQRWQNKPTVHSEYRNYHAFNFGQRFGFYSEYKHHFRFKKVSNFSIYPYVHLHYLYGQTRKNALSVINYDPNKVKQEYELRELVGHKLHVITPILGIGTNLHIYNGLSVNLKAGTGFNLVHQTNKTIPQTNSSFWPEKSFELTYQFTVGLQYQFMKKLKKE